MIPFTPINATPPAPVLSDDGPPDAVWLKTRGFTSEKYDSWEMDDGNVALCVQECSDGVCVWLTDRLDRVTLPSTPSRRDILDLIRILFPHREFAVLEPSSDFQAGVLAERKRCLAICERMAWSNGRHIPGPELLCTKAANLIREGNEPS